MLKQFKEFAMRGSVVDMAVGIVIGAAFSAIVNSVVSDLLMPPLGLVIGNVDFGNLFVVLKDGVQAAPYASLAEAQKAGAVTINYGLFVNRVINFVIVAFALFLLIRGLNQLKLGEPKPPATKECPHCLLKIPAQAHKCGYCTSELA